MRDRTPFEKSWMTQQAKIISTDTSHFRKVGMWAVLAGGLAMILVFAQIIGPSFEPSPSAAEQVGEMAGEMKRAAWSSFLGLPALEPEAQAMRVPDYLAMAAPFFGVLAVVLSVISSVKREHWRFTTYAIGLGAGAIIFQFLWWIAFLVLGVVLLVAIIENIGDFFSF